eukprot:1486503-Prymnesium_polylepis.1
MSSPQTAWRARPRATTAASEPREQRSRPTPTCPRVGQTQGPCIKPCPQRAGRSGCHADCKENLYISYNGRNGSNSQQPLKLAINSYNFICPD